MTNKKETIIRLSVLSFIAFAFLGLALVNNYVINKYKTTLYVKNIIKEPTQAVYNEMSNAQEADVQVIIPPYAGDDINEGITFYDKDDSAAIQQKSLIHYESTYLPSTGILYTSDYKFDVIAICDGEIINIEKDNILGNHIIVKHNDNLIVNYYSVEDINVKKGDIISQGQILGVSSKSKISNNLESFLFEVSYQGELINPKNIYNQKITNFS